MRKQQHYTACRKVAETKAPCRNLTTARVRLADDCPVDVSKGESTPDVLQWATSLGADCKSLRADTTLKVRGVVATADIPAGSVIASLPRKIVLSVSPEQKCPIPDLVPETIWGSTPK